MDKQKIDQFWTARTQIEDPRIATNYRDDGRLQFDSNFILDKLAPEARILDLGAGGCTLACSLLNHASQVVAVDKYAGFLEKAPAHPRLTTVCSDAVSYFDSSFYDMILLFGVANFMSDDEQLQLYSNCSRMLSANGKFIVKNQCGIHQEIVVDKFSEELSCHYHARYPAVEEQRRLLEQSFTVDVIDIYPPQLNRWETTHFYAFVCDHQ